METNKNWPASETLNVQISELKPFDNNARTHSKNQIQQIADAIQKWGWTSPILITLDKMIIAGHGRFLAAKQLGLKFVPAMIAKDWSDDDIRAYVIADNQLALNAGWNEELLAFELSQLKEAGFAIDLIGFSEAEIRELIPNQDKYLTDPDDVPNISKTTITQFGDIWQLGNHRLICGDATDAETYRKLLDGEQADACWTDPPYNVNYQGKAGSIKNDNLANDKFLTFLKSSFECIYNNLKSGGSIYVAHADTEGSNFRIAFNETGFKLSGVLIWEKNSLVLGRSDYQWKHEPILYGWKQGAAHNWYGDRKQTTVSGLNGAVFAHNEDGSINIRIGNEVIIIEGKELRARAIEPSIIRVDKPKQSIDHPTMKPVELITSMLKNSSKENDIILDPFGGSGSTLIASEMLVRKGRLIEFDPIYCDVIVKRWEELTGLKALKLP